MPWVLDGSNLAGGGNRERVRRAALALARRERLRLLVFFDGAPPAGAPATEHLGPVEVRYVPHADTAILAHLATAGAGWIVATDDAALGRQAHAAGGRVVGSAAFWEKSSGPAKTTAVERSGASVEDELAYFRDDARRLPAGPRRVVRRRRS